MQAIGLGGAGAAAFAHDPTLLALALAPSALANGANRFMRSQGFKNLYQRSVQANENYSPKELQQIIRDIRLHLVPPVAAVATRKDKNREKK